MRSLWTDSHPWADIPKLRKHFKRPPPIDIFNIIQNLRKLCNLPALVQPLGMLILRGKFLWNLKKTRHYYKYNILIKPEDLQHSWCLYSHLEYTSLNADHSLMSVRNTVVLTTTRKIDLYVWFGKEVLLWDHIRRINMNRCILFSRGCFHSWTIFIAAFILKIKNTYCYQNQFLLLPEWLRSFGTSTEVTYIFNIYFCVHFGSFFFG